MLMGAIPPKAMSDFSSSWLYEYNPDEYDLEIHPYTPNDINDITLGDMNILWDLNSDGIVNIIDFVIISQLDMTKMIEDMEILKKIPLTSEGLESLVLGIYLQEINYGISHFKLFKILLWQSDFDVLVYEAQAGVYIYAKILWEKDSEKGWVKIVWQNDGVDSFKYTFEYGKEER
jgi:hypothetical protein